MLTEAIKDPMLQSWTRSVSQTVIDRIGPLFGGIPTPPPRPSKTIFASFFSFPVLYFLFYLLLFLALFARLVIRKNGVTTCSWKQCRLVVLVVLARLVYFGLRWKREGRALDDVRFVVEYAFLIVPPVLLVRMSNEPSSSLHRGC